MNPGFQPISYHEVAECHAIRIEFGKQVSRDLMKRRNKFSHLGIQVFKLPVAIRKHGTHGT